MAKVHLIGNAHLDPVWLWRWQEGCAEALATFRSALDRMNEFPDFVFTCACAAYYEWVEQIDPDMFREIQARVAEGRWVIVGGWYIQPDCNAPSGESFARHSLYAQRYFMSRFGVRAHTGYNVDSFGHASTLPQILCLSGMENYVYMRPNDETEKRYPFPDDAFCWRGTDGSTVKAFRIPLGYGSGAFGEAAGKARELLARGEAQELPEMSFYGVGNHGGGPTIGNLEALEQLRAESGECAYSSPDAYFASLDETALKTLDGELQHHASGCYSAVSDVKRLNRKAENRLFAAEAFGVLAKSAGAAGDADSLEGAWKRVLFNQFHDIMGGCSIRAAYEDAIEDFGYALSEAGHSLNRALQAIAWRVDTSRGLPVIRSKADFRMWQADGRGTPYHVFNPHPWPIQAVVDTGCNASYAEDEFGQPIPCQTARTAHTFAPGGNGQLRLCVSVPALGWTTVYLHQEEKPLPEPTRPLSASETALENEWMRVEFDGDTGLPSRVWDKQRGELLSAPASALVVDETHCDTWSHAVFAFRDVVGRFGGAKVTGVEIGRVCATLRVTSRYNDSLLEQAFTLYRDKPGLFVETRAIWLEKHKLLKLSFPTPFASGESASGAPYGRTVRAQDGDEQPMRGWVTLREGGRALGFAGDAASAYDALDGEVRVTALRSPVYADHTFGKTEREQPCEYTEQGEKRFSWALFALGEDDKEARRAACELSAPVESFPGTYHTGALAQSFEGARVSEDNVQIGALKRAEDGNGVVVRLYETEGRETETEIELPTLNLRFTARFKANQIRSWRAFGETIEEINLLEERMNGEAN